MIAQPTNITTLTDLATVAGVADVVIDGALLWVSPGQTPAGRYWALFTPAHLLAGTVVEMSDGSFDAMIGAGAAHATTAQDAAVAVVASLRSAA
ncbi:hypothetical protein [Kitasatospora sp. NPDC056731]|uniref:hypothetical protein n=1 Tax=Kitasatospora sp. NPDC056731 TaxID=3155422 RepID=UPI00343F3660